MRKNIIFIITGVILIGSLFVIIPMGFFFGASKLLETGKVELAGKIFSQLSNIFPHNTLLELKKADVLYKQKKYQEALIKYLQVKCEGKDLCHTLHHNLGNTLYRFGDTFEEPEQKKNFWEQSLSSYKEALSHKMDLQTEQNYEFVLKKIKELEESQPPESQTQPEEQQNNEAQLPQEKADKLKEKLNDIFNSF